MGIGWASVVALSVRWHSRYVLAEIFAYTLCVFVLLQVNAVRRFLAQAGVFHRWAFAVMLGGMFFGQIASSSRTFPFIAWSMFDDVEATGEFSYFQLEGVRKDGSRVRLSPARLYPSLSRTWITWGPLPFIGSSALLTEDEAAWASAKKRSDDVVMAIGRRYNLEHPENTLGSVDVIRVRASSRRSGPPDQREIAWAVELDHPR